MLPKTFPQSSPQEQAPSGWDSVASLANQGVENAGDWPQGRFRGLGKVALAALNFARQWRGQAQRQETSAFDLENEQETTVKSLDSKYKSGPLTEDDRSLLSAAATYRGHEIERLHKERAQELSERTFNEPDENGLHISIQGVPTFDMSERYNGYPELSAAVEEFVKNGGAVIDSRLDHFSGADPLLRILAGAVHLEQNLLQKGEPIPSHGR